MLVPPGPYGLCRRCAERQGKAALPFGAAPGNRCWLCGGTMDRVPGLAEKVAKELRKFDFRTFSVGVSMPDGVQEREDELRSNLRLKGNETIKIQAARLLSAQVSRSLRRRVEKSRPDVGVVVDFGSGGVTVNSRPVFFYGRYTKPRGVRQRRSFCPRCRGTGCRSCRNTGFEQRPSVEEGVRKKLAGFSGSSKVTFTWLGSEDRESRVYPPGRPFVAEIKSPKRRDLPKKFGFRTSAGTVKVVSGKVLRSQPVGLPSFRFSTKIRAVAAAKVTPQGVADLEAAFRRAEVTFERPHGRPTLKTVYSATARAKGRTLLIEAELDGGLPVKRFVSGELVSPSVSEVLKTEVGCRSFDICGVKEVGSFKFAEVARSKKKD